MSYDLSKKKRGAQNHSNDPRTPPPSRVSKCREFSELWDGGVETKKNAGPNKVRPWRAPKIPVERKLNTVFIFAPRVTIHGRFPRSGCPPPPRPVHAPLYWLASYKIPRSAEARIILILCPAFGCAVGSFPKIIHSLAGARRCLFVWRWEERGCQVWIHMYRLCLASHV